MELLESIQAAFPVEPVPPMTLHQGRLADESIRREISDKEWHEAATLDVGNTWATLSDADLIDCSCALSHFDEQSFCYHLPAFLEFAVRNITAPFLSSEQQLVGSVLFAITDRSPYSLSRYIQLTAAQRTAVISFLEFVQIHSQHYNEDAHKALERYLLKPHQPIIAFDNSRIDTRAR